MKHKLADRVLKIQPSFTLQMATIAAEMKSRGENVINFSVGEPDFNTPEHIINAGKRAMDQGYTKYTAGPGMIEFRQAICEKLNRENGIKYDIDDTIELYVSASVIGKNSICMLIFLKIFIKKTYTSSLSIIM